MNKNKSTSPWIAQLHFDNSKNAIWATVIANLALFLLFLVVFTTEVLSYDHALFCLATTIIMMSLCFQYSWKNPEFNLLIIVLYLVSLLAEYFIVGMPNNPLGFSENVGRGMVLEMLVGMFPMMYYAFRSVAVIPLIFIYAKAKRLERIVN